MRRIPINLIGDGNVLAKDVFSSTGVVLMSEGTTLKREYISRLRDLSIDYVFVREEDGEAAGLERNSDEREFHESSKKQIRETLEKYTYSEGDRLKQVLQIAEDIIMDALSEPNVMYSVSCVRDKDNALYLHSLNVATLSTIIALRGGFSRSKVRDITIGALLHDIGFLTVTVDTDNVVLEQCDDKTKKEIMRHVVYGYSDVEKKDWLSKTAKEIILQHHERLDGSGYPFHMIGEHLKPEVRIVSLCDQFDCMIYGNLMERCKVRDAMDYIMSQAGAKFDFNFVSLFLESVAAYPTGTVVYTNEGDCGIVIHQNYKFPTRPVLRLIKRKDGREYPGVVEKDLTKCLTVFIVDSLEN